MTNKRNREERPNINAYAYDCCDTENYYSITKDYDHKLKEPENALDIVANASIITIMACAGICDILSRKRY